MRCIARVSRRAAAFLAAPAMFERWFDLYYRRRCARVHCTIPLL